MISPPEPFRRSIAIDRSDPRAPITIYCHDYCTADGAADKLPEGLSQRGLLLAEASDIVLLDARVSTDHCHYLRSLGLGPQADNVIFVDGDLRSITAARLVNDRRALRQLQTRVGDAAAVRLDCYLPSPPHVELRERLAELLGRPVELHAPPAAVIAAVNDKRNMRAAALACGVPIAAGEVILLADADQRGSADRQRLIGAIHRNACRTGGVIVRGANGVSGSSTYVIRSIDQVEAIADRILRERDNKAFLVEELVNLVASPNVLMRIDPGDGRARLIGASDQRLGVELHHSGNLFPSAASTVEQMVRAAREMCHWLWESGYYGIAGFDFVEYRVQGSARPRFLLAEVNARVNAAYYPLVLLQKLNRDPARPPVGAFATAHFRGLPLDFERLADRAGSLLLRPAGAAGIVPLRFCEAPAPIFSAIAVGESRAEAEGLLDTLGTLLEPGVDRRVRVSGTLAGVGGALS